MRKYAFAIAIATLFAFPTSAWSQEIEFEPGGVRIEPSYHHYYRGRSAWRPGVSRTAESVPLKEELGEVGQGNCQRYRHFCRG
jgi:hypothetical protein